MPIRYRWLACTRPMCAFSLRADIDGRDSLDGYRNRSRYYQRMAHEVLIRAVAATGMSVQGLGRVKTPFVGQSVIRIGNCFPFWDLTKNFVRCNFRLLQQNPPNNG